MPDKDSSTPSPNDPSSPEPRLNAGARPADVQPAPAVTIAASDTVGDAVAALQKSPQHRGRVMLPGGDAVDLYLGDSEMEQQLRTAREVQQRLLPRGVPTVPGFEFAGRFRAAGQVGGDYWSVKYYRAENIITCKLADVTGHGIGAAILVAAIKFVSGVLFRYSPSPAAVIERTNHSLLHETTPDRMATMVYAWVYPQTHQVRLVNAGHAPAFLCRANGEIVEIPPTGPLLGLMETSYEEIVHFLHTGDLLFFCSDGISEAGAPNILGEAAVREIVRENRQERAEKIADAVLAAALSQGTALDDMSLLIVKACAEATGKKSVFT